MATSVRMMPDLKDMRTILRAAVPPAQGAVPRRESRTMREAVRRLDMEAEAFVRFIAAPLHETLQELAERISRP